VNKHLPHRGRRTFAAALVFFLVVMGAAPALADQVIPDDLIVNGGTASECVGFDCVDGESFGSDTLRLKENNTRINFTDTSASGFPGNDWTLTANDGASTANGGLDKFSIDDVTGSKTPFTIEAGAATNSLYVDSSNRVGFGTNNPIMQLHAVSSNTPGLRLEQNNDSGFRPYTWDVAGNEASFFIRDVTGGSNEPFVIRPGAPTNSIKIAGNGDVGIDNPSPTSALHVARSDGTAQIAVDETKPTSQTRTLLALTNNGSPRVRFVNAAAADTWTAGSGGARHFTINNGGNPADFNLDSSGNLTIQGTLTQSSDRNVKDHVRSVHGRRVLAKLSRLPMSRWSYQDDDGVRHLGPMAQDFFAAYRLGDDRRHISPSDLAGVGLAAIKAMHRQQRASDRRVTALRKHERTLSARVHRLERAVANMRN